MNTIKKNTINEIPLNRLNPRFTKYSWPQTSPNKKASTIHQLRATEEIVSKMPVVPTAMYNVEVSQIIVEQIRSSAE